jgi:hypothetical protein
MVVSLPSLKLIPPCEATFVPLLLVLQGDYAWSTNAISEGKDASVILDVRLRL